MQGLLLRGRDVDSRQLRFEFADDEAEQLYLDWENATAREKQSRTMFASALSTSTRWRASGRRCARRLARELTWNGS